MHLELSRDVAAPTDVVWGVIADVARAPEVIGAIESVEIVSGTSPVELGTTWRETRQMFGRSHAEELTVSAIDPGRSYTVTADSSGARMESTLSVLPSATGSTLAMTLDAKGTNPLFKVTSAVMGKLLSSANRKALEQDLADMARAAEARGSGREPGSGGSPAPG